MMVKIVKWVSLSFVIAIILCFFIFYFFLSGVNKKIIYTESEFFNYYRLTDKSIQQVPRISKEYYFVSEPGDGYAPSNTVVFEGVSDVSPLKSYLKNLGYTKENRRLGENEIWSKQGQVNGDVFYLYFNRLTGEATLSKVMNN